MSEVSHQYYTPLKPGSLVFLFYQLTFFFNESFTI